MSDSNALPSTTASTDLAPTTEDSHGKPGFWTHISSSAKTIMTQVENTLHEWFSMHGIRAFPDALHADDAIYLLGKHYSSNSQDILAMKSDFSCRPHFTYRHSFPPIGKSKFTSDSGWGCMIRVGQCLFLEGLLRLKFGREYAHFPTDPIFKEYIQLFLDTPSAPFSIHSIAKMGSLLDTPIGDWFGPTTMAQAIKKLALEHSHFPRIVVAQDATVFCMELEDAFAQSSSDGVILLIPLRLGISAVHPSYHPFIKAFFTCSTAIGVAGDCFLILDPHVTQPCLSNNFETIHTQQVLCLPLSSLDPSLCFGFAFNSKREWDDWKVWIKQERENIDIPFSFQDVQWKEEENIYCLSESDQE